MRLLPVAMPLPVGLSAANAQPAPGPEHSGRFLLTVPLRHDETKMNAK